VVVTHLVVAQQTVQHSAVHSVAVFVQALEEHALVANSLTKSQKTVTLIQGEL
jgi:hypothetical protein